jgi:hypothetical protein
VRWQLSGDLSHVRISIAQITGFCKFGLKPDNMGGKSYQITLLARLEFIERISYDGK